MGKHSSLFSPRVGDGEKSFVESPPDGHNVEGQGQVGDGEPAQDVVERAADVDAETKTSGSD